MDSDEITIHDLYPHMSEAELHVAEQNLQRYVALVVRVYERLTAEGKCWPDPPSEADLTAAGKHPRIPDERSNSTNN